MQDPRTRVLKRLEHGQLLSAKSVMDNAMSELQDIKELIAEKLHDEFDRLIDRFEDTLAGCDVSQYYEEKPR